MSNLDKRHKLLKEAWSRMNENAGLNRKLFTLEENLSWVRRMNEASTVFGRLGLSDVSNDELNNMLSDDWETIEELRGQLQRREDSVKEIQAEIERREKSEHGLDGYDPEEDAARRKAEMDATDAEEM